MRATAAAGWLALAFYALAGTDGMATVSRDYVHYMTSKSDRCGTLPAFAGGKV